MFGRRLAKSFVECICFFNLLKKNKRNSCSINSIVDLNSDDQVEFIKVTFEALSTEPCHRSLFNIQF